MSDLVMPEPIANQRVVLLHTGGVYAGIHQITGHVGLFGGQVPFEVAGFESTLPDHRPIVAAKLARVTPRIVLYKELDRENKK